MVNKLDEQTFTSELESHWVSHLDDLVPHLSKLLLFFDKDSFGN